MAVISEDSIKAWIVPYLSKGKRGTKIKIALSEIVSAIIYRLKTGSQWRELPVKQFLKEGYLGWQGACSICRVFNWMEVRRFVKRR